MKDRTLGEYFAYSVVIVTGLIILTAAIWFGIKTPILGVFVLSIVTLAAFFSSLEYIATAKRNRRLKGKL